MARFDPEIHHRRSIRLRGYDYSRAGLYFVTLCAHAQECLFGEVVDDDMRPNECGQAVAGCWKWLADRYGYVELDAFVVMPNYLHGVLVIGEEASPPERVQDRNAGVGDEGGSRTAPTNAGGASGVGKRKPLGRLIGAFKTVSTQRVNEILGTPSVTLWQRNYYEHIIRNDADLARVRRYIANNPANWARDAENPRFPRPDLGGRHRS